MRQHSVLLNLSLAVGLLSAGACATATSSSGSSGPSVIVPEAPSPDPRVGLRAGMFDAAEATWNMRVVSKTPPPKDFLGVTNSDLAFIGPYAIQGNYNGYQVWDISNPSMPTLKKAYVCPAS